MSLSHQVDDKTDQHKGVNHFEKQMQFLIFRQFCESRFEWVILCRKMRITEGGILFVLVREQPGRGETVTHITFDLI